jgi:hypothetical protein
MTLLFSLSGYLMIKLFTKVGFVLSLLFAGTSQATIIPLNVNILTTDNYNGVD